jgi:hypothetical protein
MLRRLTISFFLLLAFALLQAHNFIPHHHHEEEVQASHHDDHDEDSKEEHDSPFTDLTHNADFGKVIAKSKLYKEIIEKPIFSEGILFRLFAQLDVFESPSPPRPPDDTSPLHQLFLSHSLPLRAPPASVC